MCALCVLMYIADSARMCGVCAFILSAALERQQLNNLGTKSSCCEKQNNERLARWFARNHIHAQQCTTNALAREGAPSPLVAVEG